MAMRSLTMWTILIEFIGRVNDIAQQLRNDELTVGEVKSRTIGLVEKLLQDLS